MTTAAPQKIETVNLQFLKEIQNQTSHAENVLFWGPPVCMEFLQIYITEMMYVWAWFQVVWGIHRHTELAIQAEHQEHQSDAHLEVR